VKRIRFPPFVIGSGSDSNADCCPVVVSILRQTPEVVAGTGAVVLPLVDYAAVSVPHPVVFQVPATVDINYTARAVTPSDQIPMFIVGFRQVAPLIYSSTVGRMAPFASRSKSEPE
jgi:hypothetical protein